VISSNILLQSALQPLWVMACSTIVEYSQQEGFYRVSLPAARQTPQLGGPVIRTFQPPPPGVPHVWNDASEPQQRKVELWARNFREFCRKWRLPRHFWVLLHAVNLRHGKGGFTSPPKEGALRIFFARKIRRFRSGLNPRTYRQILWKCINKKYTCVCVCVCVCKSYKWANRINDRRTESTH